MARSTQPPPRTRSTTSPVRLIAAIVALLLAVTLTNLPTPAESKEVPQGCSFHPQEKLVSCRNVNATLLQDFLLQVITTTSPQPENVTVTTTSPSPHPHAANTTITTTFATTESKNVSSNARNTSGAPRRDSSGITELSCVGCRVPELTSTLSLPSLHRLSIIHSGIERVLPDALASHTLTLVHLDFSYNLLETVPEAVGSLARLQVLDLRHNKIRRVAAGMALSAMRGLRYLYLDYNQLGQTPSSSSGQGAHQSVFDLWSNLDTPSLPRLSHLGLSLNGIKEVPSGSFSRLKNLLHLDLSNNLLTSLNENDLPASILNLDLGGNPWNCTCEASWILERRGPRPPNTTAAASVPATTITAPTCHSPLHLRRRRLDLLKASDICPSEEAASGNKVVYVGDDVEGTLRDAFRGLRLLNATTLTTHALLISWRVDAGFYSLSAPLKPLSWAVTVQDVSKDPREAQVTRLRLEKYKEQPGWTPGDGLFAEVLEGLKADTAYVICLTVMQGRRIFTRPGHCLHSTTFSTLTAPQRPDSPTASEALKSYSTRDYDIRTEAFTVWTEPHSASLSWNVTVLPRQGRSRALMSRENVSLRPLGWKVSYHRSEGDGDEEEEEVEVVLVSRGGETLQNFTNNYSIEGLLPGKRYVFCLHTLTEEEVQESLAGNSLKRPRQDVSSPQPVASLPWEAHAHTLPTTARGRSVVDERGGARQNLETNSVLPALPHPHPHPHPHSSKTAPPAQPAPATHTLPPPPASQPPFDVPATSSFSPKPPSTSISSNFPPVPPSLPPLPHSRPPRPPRPQLGGGFVYTSSGKRIPLPSGPPGLLPPFNVPPPIPIRAPGPPRAVPPPPSASQSPSGQRFIYEFEETSSPPPPPPPPTTTTPSTAATTTTQQPLSASRVQIYTYQTRRRRAVEGHRPESLKAAPMCRQVVTPVELDVVLPAAIAATISCAATVVVVLLVCCCCWPRRCCRRKAAWRSRSLRDSRKVSTISAPFSATVFSGHTSAAAGTARGDGETTSTGEVPSGSDRAGRSLSTTSSSGYLTPLHSPDGGSQRLSPDPKAAYLSLMQSRLLQRHKDLPEFHPGYDIPPTASSKKFVGYDYPHPTPVTSAPPSLQLPSPSSSDSNYNVSIGNSPEPERNPAEVNLNLPSHHTKSSGLSKSVHVPPDVTDNSNYIYTAGETPATKAVRTYLKHPPPCKARHRKFGQQPQPGADEHNLQQSLSRSTPDLITAAVDEAETTTMNPSSEPSHATSIKPPASIPYEARNEHTRYVNFPAVQKDTETSKQNGNNSSNSKDREPYHTWAGHTAKARPGVGEVVLSGGTLIEVPEGYVVPNPPKPTPFIRLLVRGQDEPTDSLKTTQVSQSTREKEGGSGSRGLVQEANATHPSPQTDHNRLVINTAVAL